MKKSKSIKLHGIEILEHINLIFSDQEKYRRTVTREETPGQNLRLQNLSDTEELMDDLERKRRQRHKRTPVSISGAEVQYRHFSMQTRGTEPTTFQ